MRPGPGLCAALAAGGVLTVISLSGCAPEPDAGATAAARSFVSAVEHGDGAAACRALTKNAEESVSGATDVPCAKAIVSIDENGDSVRASQVWGDAAQVRIGGDVVFLRRYPHGWRVSAAGCTRQPAGPYDCTVG